MENEKDINEIEETKVEETEVKEETVLEDKAIESDELKEETNDEDLVTVDDMPNNKYDTFAIVGFVTGLVVLGISLVGFGIFVFWIGIIFSCIGNKSIKHKKYASLGLLFSIFALVVAIMYFIFI